MKLILLVACAALAWAQQSQDSATSNLPAQKIGSNDLVSISVYQSPEFSRTVRVTPEGNIRLPMLKQPVKAVGLLPAELEQSVAEALQSEQLVVDPFVTVSVVEYHSRPITVAGAVRKPITFQAIGSITLLDALTKAEGLAADAGPDILVSAADATGAAGVVRRIPVRGLIDAKDPKLNLRLTGGEDIRIPEAGKVYVVGNVKHPGAFRVADNGDTTLLRALALAEGLMPYASRTAYIYRRESGDDGKRSEIAVELRKIMERKSPDVPLEENDILYVPDDSSRRTTRTAIDRVLTLGGSTVSGMLVWGVAR